MRDERQSRPSTLKEMNAQRGYSPYKCIYNRSDGTQCEWNIACYLSCEDLGIICSLFIVLWACLRAGMGCALAGLGGMTRGAVDLRRR